MNALKSLMPTRMEFVDSWKLSLLHNGIRLPSIPVVHAALIKETCDNLKQLLNTIGYKKKYSWHLCGDLKVVVLLMGM